MSDRLSGRGCGGGWYRVAGGGFICASRGFEISRSPRRAHTDLADTNPQALLYQYAKVTRPGSARYYRVPEGGLEDDGAAIETRMEGDVYLAVDQLERVEGQVFARTARGRYVRAEDIEFVPAPSMVGERLSRTPELPIAFVFGGDAPVLDEQTGKRIGVAEKHSRGHVERTVSWKGENYVLLADGLKIPRDHVRVARRIRPPAGVPKGARWVHVDLGEQTLVAYEGYRPVYATLISSGKEGHETPRGIYRVKQKYVSTTMRGEDPVDGPYEVEEVPWTLYYHRSYALHGAYWHNDFGRTRSHGCTNIAPTDARWLFEWASPRLPSRWHGIRRTGSYVYFTR